MLFMMDFFSEGSSDVWMDCSKGTLDGSTLEGSLNTIPMSILDGAVVTFTLFKGFSSE